LKCALVSQISNLVRDRIAAKPTNPMYHMVQDKVELHDAGVRVRNLARVAATARLPVVGENDKQITRRQETAIEYQAASEDLRRRAVLRMDLAVLPSGLVWPGHLPNAV
jgi:hypothetical protein